MPSSSGNSFLEDLLIQGDGQTVSYQSVGLARVPILDVRIQKLLVYSETSKIFRGLECKLGSADDYSCIMHWGVLLKTAKCYRGQEVGSILIISWHASSPRLQSRFQLATEYCSTDDQAVVNGRDGSPAGLGWSDPVYKAPLNTCLKKSGPGVARTDVALGYAARHDLTGGILACPRDGCAGALERP